MLGEINVLSVSRKRSLSFFSAMAESLLRFRPIQPDLGSQVPIRGAVEAIGQSFALSGAPDRRCCSVSPCVAIPHASVAWHYIFAADRASAPAALISPLNWVVSDRPPSTTARSS